MSVTKIPENVKLRLWGKSAGRCQYQGCNKPLYFDSLTKAQFNTAYLAHIYADQANGPRYDSILSKQLYKDISNLMLLCDEHHRLIDKLQVAEHPVERLLGMKKQHEERIELTSSITPDKRSHIILFGANIGVHGVPLHFKEAADTILPTMFPADTKPIELGIKNSCMEDHTEEYWAMQESQLVQMFNRHVLPLKGNHEVQHFSIFAMAPIPLLIKLGTLLSDIYKADVYQRHRMPSTWKWQNHISCADFIFSEPKDISGIPVLKISLSGNINDDRICDIMNGNCSIWELSYPSPNNDFLKSQDHLIKFNQSVRHAFNRIKAVHGQNKVLHVFPAMPISAAIELGRVWMPKADLSMKIYDQNNKHKSFIPTISIN